MLPATIWRQTCHSCRQRMVNGQLIERTSRQSIRSNVISLSRSRSKASFSFSTSTSRSNASTTQSTTSTPSSSSVLSQVRIDLKEAMRARDSARVRLAVLRNLLAEVTNASKTPRPIETDVQFLDLLRKRLAASRTAREEFVAADRADLIAKEDNEIQIMSQYADQVPQISLDEIQQRITDVLAQLKQDGQDLKMGAVMQALIGPGGSLEGKPVDRGHLSKLVQGSL